MRRWQSEEIRRKWSNNARLSPIFPVCPIHAGDLRDLVSASNDFEVEMIEHEHVLEANPSATELAASTINYARVKERMPDEDVPRRQKRDATALRFSCKNGRLFYDFKCKNHPQMRCSTI
jgi:hypothetical protein